MQQRLLKSTDFIDTPIHLCVKNNNDAATPPQTWFRISGENGHFDAPLENYSDESVNIHPWHLHFWLSSLYMFIFLQKMF